MKRKWEDEEYEKLGMLRMYLTDSRRCGSGLGYLRQPDKGGGTCVRLRVGESQGVFKKAKLIVVGSHFSEGARACVCLFERTWTVDFNSNRRTSVFLNE